MTEQTEREAFEAWYRREFPACFHFSAPSPFRLAAGEYIDPTISPMWLAWQAAARASSPTYAAGWSAAMEAILGVESLKHSRTIEMHELTNDFGRPRKLLAENIEREIRALALPAAATDGDVVERKPYTASLSKSALGPDGKEWAKTEAGYDHVNTMMGRADDKQNLMWHGWALREAFVAGAEWQEARPPKLTFTEKCAQEAEDI